MTPEQFDRFKDFAIRLTHLVPVRAKAGRPNRGWVREAVEEIIGTIKEWVGCLHSWDHSLPYPVGHKYYDRRYRCPCWNCCPNYRDRVVKTPCPYRCEGGKIYDYAKPLCLNDELNCWVSSTMDYNIRFYATSKEIVLRKKLLDDDKTDEADELDQGIMDRWISPVHSCLRAAVDLASAPSAGVCGYTAGDLRRIYPKGVPQWVKDALSDMETVEVTGVVPGVGVTLSDPVPAPGAFDEMPDDAELWL